MECPFAEAGCKIDIRRHQFGDHMTTSLQQHLLMLMIDYRETKDKLNEMENELHETKTRLCETESKLTMAIDYIAWSNKLQKSGDFVKIQMPKFSEYCRSGKIWYSPPFYYREGYKMCLAVYANGIGKGAGTHVSVVILLLKGEYDDQLKWPMNSCGTHYVQRDAPEGSYQFLVCLSLQRQEVNEYEQIDRQDRFCALNNEALQLVNDCLTFNVKYANCCLKVWIV